MKKALNIDEKLLRQAKAACGAANDTETMLLRLEALVRHAACERFRALLGTEPDPQDIPRRRDRASSRRKAA